MEREIWRGRYGGKYGEGNMEREKKGEIHVERKRGGRTEKEMRKEVCKNSKNIFKCQNIKKY